MRKVLSHVLAAVVSLIPLCAQEPLADGVTSFLGGGSVAAWFEKGGTVWVTDGTVRGTRDTGVPTGNYSLATDRLIVYRQNRIDRMNPDGSTTVLTPPFAFDGFDDDGPEPTVWRAVLQRSDAEYIELASWTPSGWSTLVVGCQADPPGSDVYGRLIHGGRYLLQWNSPGPGDSWALSDLFDTANPPECRVASVMGFAGPRRTWSEGVIYPAIDRMGESIVITVRDRGIVDSTDLRSLGGNWHSLLARELTPGFVLVSRSERSTNIAIGVMDERVFADAPGTNLGLLWTSPGEQLLAHVDQLGSRSVYWLERSTGIWSQTTGFGSPSSISLVGCHGGTTYLALGSASGTSLVAYDEATHAATTMVSGLASITKRVAPFANGFVFSADDGLHGLEPWFCDGTPNGTRLIADLREGSDSSGPRDFARLGERQIFATDSPQGVRVWSMEPQQLDWRRNPSNGHFYRLTSPAPWGSARAAARNLYGELATVRDAAEQAWLIRTFGYANLWIGLTDFNRDGNFEWASGEPLGYTNWCPGQPDRLPGETAVHIANYPGYCGGGWNDQDSLDAYPGVVERSTPPHPVEEFGMGCQGYAGQPVATARWTGGWPRPGGTVNLAFVLGSSYYSTGVLFLSADATEIRGLPLPLDLSSIGAPGCFLHVRPDDAIAQWGDPWGWSWSVNASLPLPNDPALQGMVLFVQSLAFDCTGCSEARHIRTTNALRITIGA